jgi:muramoyltetrapeptide carboxypeptidase
MYKRPPRLEAQQTIGIVAPAGKIPWEPVQHAIQVIEQHWGLKVELGKHLRNEYHQFAGTDTQRIADLQEMLDRPDIYGILCARGGYGTTRIIDQLDFSKFLRKPKWIAGFSDITALHCHLHQLGMESLHGTMPLLFNTDLPRSVESLRQVLFGAEINYRKKGHSLNRIGAGEGHLIGGNLSLLVTIIGTASDIDTTGKVLFIEDINEYRYHIDRMMTQLKRAGKLSRLAGLVVGHFTDEKDNETPFGKTAYEIIAEAVQEYKYPVCYGFPTGHEPDNLALPCGRQVKLTVHANEVSIQSGSVLA